MNVSVRSVQPRPLASKNSLKDCPLFTRETEFLMRHIAPPLLHRQLYLEANDLVFLREDCTKRALIRGDSVCQVQ